MAPPLPHSPPPGPAAPPRAESNALTLADALSLVRIPFAAALWFIEPSPRPALALMGAAAVSDALDGWVARKLRRGAPPPPGGGRGAWLDPLCDKAFVLSFVAMVALRLGAPLWVLALVGVRDALVTAAYVMYRVLGPARGVTRVNYTANPLGKLTTVLQFVALALLVARGGAATADVAAVAAASALAGTAAALSYAWRALRPGAAL